MNRELLLLVDALSREKNVPKDIVFTALAGETFPLFRNTPKIGFCSWGHRSQLDALSLLRSGWSAGLFDLNNDGWKDLFTANGHVNDTVELFEATKYKLPNSVFAGAGDGIFQDVSGEAGQDNTASVSTTNGRICFRWTTAGREDVEIARYH